jgi:uncharacterized protein YndB with AHSA1/START domain
MRMMEYSGFPRQDFQRALAITRVFDAPRALVWKAWTVPAHVKRWMGPRGFTATHLDGDLRPRGVWRACLRRDDNGEEFWQGGVYLDIVAPERLIYSFAWDDTRQRRNHVTLVTLVFTERRGKTTMSFRQEVFETVEERDGHERGWTSAFDRLVEHLGEIRPEGGLATSLSRTPRTRVPGVPPNTSPIGE